jgi:hypothetical protein
VVFSSANNSQISAILGKFATTGTPGGLVTSASGYDIVFASDPGCLTIVNFERAIWNTNPSLVEFFFRATTNGTYYLCIGNSSVTTDQSHKTATWNSDFKRVWHMPNGGTLTSPAPDSTSNADNATLNNTPTVATSPVGGAAVFNGSSYLSQSGYAPASNAFSVFLWAKVPVLSGGTKSLLGGKSPSSGAFGLRVNNVTGKLDITRTGIGDNSTSTTGITANTWARIVYTNTAGSTNYAFWINGSGVGGFTSGLTPFGETNLTGAGENLSEFCPCSEGEVYFTDNVVSNNWIADDWNSQKPFSTFITVSSLNPVGGIPPAIY